MYCIVQHLDAEAAVFSQFSERICWRCNAIADAHAAGAQTHITAVRIVSFRDSEHDVVGQGVVANFSKLQCL
jgi:hypothetical protein